MMFIRNTKVYDVLKTLQRIWLPALATLYVALAKIWGWPYSAEIAGTITAVVAFLGAVLEISSSEFHKQEEGEPVDE